MWKKKKTPNGQNNVNKRSDSVGFTISKFKLYHKAKMVKTGWYWDKKKDGTYVTVISIVMWLQDNAHCRKDSKHRGMKLYIYLLPLEKSTQHESKSLM